MLEEPRYWAGDDEAELMCSECLGAVGTRGPRGTRVQTLRLPGGSQSRGGAIQGTLESQGEGLSSGSWVSGERQVLLRMLLKQRQRECPDLPTSTIALISPSASSIRRPEGHGTWEGSLPAMQSGEREKN